MDAVARGVAVYLFILVMMRLSGRRTLGEMTTFDFVLLLIVAETTQQALLGDDYSVINSFILIVTLVALDVLISLIKRRSGRIERILDGMPMVVVENGKLLADRMQKARIDEADVLTAARKLRGLERLDQVKYAVLEADGGITIIPEERNVTSTRS